MSTDTTTTCRYGIYAVRLRRWTSPQRLSNNTDFLSEAVMASFPHTCNTPEKVLVGCLGYKCQVNKQPDSGDVTTNT